MGFLISRSHRLVQDQSLWYPMIIGVEDMVQASGKKMLVRESQGICVPSGGAGFKAKLRAYWGSAHEQKWHEQGVSEYEDTENEPQAPDTGSLAVWLMPSIPDGARLPSGSEVTSEERSGRALQGVSSETLGQLAGAGTNSPQPHSLVCSVVIVVFCFNCAQISSDRFLQSAYIQVTRSRYRMFQHPAGPLVPCPQSVTTSLTSVIIHHFDLFLNVMEVESDIVFSVCFLLLNGMSARHFPVAACSCDLFIFSAGYYSTL